MNRWKNNLLGLAMIAAGLGLAMPFRQLPPTPEAAGGRTSGESLQPLALQIAAPTEVSPVWESDQPVGADDDEPAMPQRVSLEGLQPPPSLASEFEPLQRPSVRLFRPAANSVEAAPEDSRRHVLTDGDTLQDLAERYLGDRQHWRALWDANAAVLSSPDLLPVGQEITIPPQLIDSATDQSTAVKTPSE